MTHPDLESRARALVDEKLIRAYWEAVEHYGTRDLVLIYAVGDSRYPVRAFSREELLSSTLPADIKAKVAGMPLYQLLGGRSRDGILCYGHANGGDIAETVDAVGHYIDLGYKAIRAQSGVPGVKDAYGVGRGKLYYEPADATLASVTGWDTRKALNYVPKLFEELRKTYGFDHHLLTHRTPHRSQRRQPREIEFIGVIKHLFLL